MWYPESRNGIYFVMAWHQSTQNSKANILYKSSFPIESLFCFNNLTVSDGPIIRWIIFTILWYEKFYHDERNNYLLIVSLLGKRMKKISSNCAPSQENQLFRRIALQAYKDGKIFRSLLALSCCQALVQVRVQALVQTGPKSNKSPPKKEKRRIWTLGWH